MSSSAIRCHGSSGSGEGKHGLELVFQLRRGERLRQERDAPVRIDDFALYVETTDGQDLQRWLDCLEIVGQLKPAVRSQPDIGHEEVDLLGPLSE